MEEGRKKRSSSGGGRLRTFSSERLRRERNDSDASENRTGEDNRLANNDGLGDRSLDEKPSNSAAQLKTMRDRIYKKERQVAALEPELHIIGEIEGGSDFGPGVCCRWQVDHGTAWVPLGGHLTGQTQVDYPKDNDSAVWCHPLDVHFLCKGVQGWPRLLLQVWQMDEFGRLHLSGYGFAHVPNATGAYEIEVTTWRPVGTLKEEISGLFLGTTPQLRDIDLLFSKAWSDRSRITTQSSGTIRLNVDVVVRNFGELDVDMM